LDEISCESAVDIESPLTFASLGAVQFDTIPSTLNSTDKAGGDELSANDRNADLSTLLPILLNLRPFNTLTFLEPTLWDNTLTSFTSNTPMNCSFKKDNVTFSNTTVVSLSISSVTPSKMIRTLEEKRSVVGALLDEDRTGEMVVGSIDGSRDTDSAGLLLNFSSILDNVGVAVILDVTGVAVGP